MTNSKDFDKSIVDRNIGIPDGGVDISDLIHTVTMLEDEASKPFSSIPDPIYLSASMEIIAKALYYTPVDTGNLIGSLYIKPITRGFEIGYTADYAVYVHEITENHHEPPTRSKFLEDAAFEIQSDFRASHGVDVPIKIEYSPLRIFVGGLKTPGERITHSFRDKYKLHAVSLLDGSTSNIQNSITGLAGKLPKQFSNSSMFRDPTSDFDESIQI